MHKQEFSIEIPDKEADAIHSGEYHASSGALCILMISQSSKQWTTSWLSLMVRTVYHIFARVNANCHYSALDRFIELDTRYGGLGRDLSRFFRRRYIIPCV